MTELRGPILAAIDLTDAANEVLAQANAFAVSLSANLIVCHRMHETLQARMFPQLEAAYRATRRDREAVETRVEAVTGRSPVEIVVESGSTPAAILRQIERTRAGLAVVGPGRVAELVARHAPCAVLIARPSKRGCVLGATDLSDASLSAMEIAASEAVRRLVNLRLMYCLEFASPLVLGSIDVAFGVLPALPAEVVEQFEKSSRERLDDALRRLGAVGQGLVTFQRAEQSIVDTARRVEAELIVIGMHDRSTFSRLLHEGVAESVIRNAPCSVLVVHPAPSEAVARHSRESAGTPNSSAGAERIAS